VFSYQSKTANGRTVLELLKGYDVLVLNMHDSDHKQYYAENMKLLEGQDKIVRLFIGKLSEQTKEDKLEIIDSWKIDYFVKKIPAETDSKEQLMHKMLCVLLPKPRQMSKRKMFWQGVVKFITEVVPKLFS
jgi:hypothetical protein